MRNSISFESYALYYLFLSGGQWIQKRILQDRGYLVRLEAELIVCLQD